MKRWILPTMLLSEGLAYGQVTMTVTGKVESDTTGAGVNQIGDVISFTLTFNEHPDAGLEFAFFRDGMSMWLAESTYDFPETDFTEGVSVWTDLSTSIFSGALSNRDSSYEPTEVLAVSSEERSLSNEVLHTVNFQLISEMGDTGFLYGAEKVASVSGKIYLVDPGFPYPGVPTPLIDWVRANKGDYQVNTDPNLYDDISVVTATGILSLDPSGTLSASAPEPITWFGYTADANGIIDTGNWMGLLYAGNLPWLWSYKLEAWIYVSTISTEAGEGLWIFVVKPGS